MRIPIVAGQEFTLDPRALVVDQFVVSAVMLQPNPDQPATPAVVVELHEHPAASSLLRRPRIIQAVFSGPGSAGMLAGLEGAVQLLQNIHHNQEPPQS